MSDKRKATWSVLRIGAGAPVRRRFGAVFGWSV